METSFDNLLPRSASDGNLVRTPSERFLLQNFDHSKTYGTCSGSSSLWTSFQEHIVAPGDTLAGVSLRYNITLQDLKLANKLWTNEGLWPGRRLKIPVIELVTGSLDLSVGSSTGSDTMSTDSQLASAESSSSSRRVSSTDLNSSRRVSSTDLNQPLQPSIGSNANGSLLSLPSHSRPSQPRSPLSDQATAPPSTQRRASVEDLSKFLSAMDSSIAQNTKVSISLIKGSSVRRDQREQLERGENGFDVRTNNNTRGRREGGQSLDHIC